MNEVPPLGEDLSAGRSAAEQKVKNPALAMMIVAIVGAVLTVVSLLAQIMGFMPSSFGGLEEPLPIVIDAASAVLGLVFMGVIYFGALRMQRLESWGFALAATIVCMLPCSLCCIAGLPIGIWSLVVLMDAEVKKHFR